MLRWAWGLPRRWRWIPSPLQRRRARLSSVLAVKRVVQSLRLLLVYISIPMTRTTTISQPTDMRRPTPMATQRRPPQQYFLRLQAVAVVVVQLQPRRPAKYQRCPTRRTPTPTPAPMSPPLLLLLELPLRRRRLLWPQPLQTAAAATAALGPRSPHTWGAAAAWEPVRTAVAGGGEY